jgi:hypothetical protein
VYAFFGLSLAWRDRVDIALYALVALTLVLLYRHRHDPDLDEP